MQYGTTSAKRKVCMNNPLLTSYFQRLRRLYSCELQLMSFLPELQSRTASRHLAGEMEDHIAFCRERRDALELLALFHGLSSAGDPCAGMASLIRTEWKALGDESGSHLQNDYVSDIAEALHRKLIMDYSLARSLAAKLRFPADAEVLDGVVDRLIGLFPGVWRHPDPVLVAEAS